MPSPIVASAPGIPHFSLSSKLYVAVKSHGGQDANIQIVQQIAIMMGCAVLPHLRNLVPQLPPMVSSLASHDIKNGRPLHMTMLPLDRGDAATEGDGLLSLTEGDAIIEGDGLLRVTLL